MRLTQSSAAFVLGFAGLIAPVGATNLLTCTNSSGAVVYTRTPEALGSEFKCKGAPQRKPATEGSASKLDPTPSTRRENSDCPSTARLKVTSSSYSGSFNVELRKGNRPGSVRISGGSVSDGGEVIFLAFV
jgi:hypothetical protein